MKLRGLISPFFLIAPIALLFVSGFLFYINGRVHNAKVVYPSQGAAQGNPVYSNDLLGIKFRLPGGLEVIEENDSTLRIGMPANPGYIEYLTISKDGKVRNYRSYEFCWGKEYPTSDKPCIFEGNFGWGQESTIEDRIIDTRTAKSFYIAEALSHGDFHIVLFEGQPVYEFKMYVSGGGLDKNFEEILSSLEFYLD